SGRARRAGRPGGASDAGTARRPRRSARPGGTSLANRPCCPVFAGSALRAGSALWTLESSPTRTARPDDPPALPLPPAAPAGLMALDEPDPAFVRLHLFHAQFELHPRRSSLRRARGGKKAERGKAGRDEHRQPKARQVLSLDIHELL